MQRRGAYVVVYNKERKLMTDYKPSTQRYYLPGGGIDEGEKPEEAIVREVLEENGLTIRVTDKIGEANQVCEHTTLGPMNKLGIFYKGELTDTPSITPIEDDAELRWIDPKEFLKAKAHDFYKWAIKKAL